MFILPKTIRYKQEARGFTLVETLVAITILLVVIVGPLTIAQKGIQSSYYAGEQTTAVYLAQEAIEHIQKLRDDVALHSFQDYKDGVNNDLESTRSWHASLVLDTNCTEVEGCDVDMADIDMAYDDMFVDCSLSQSECTLKIQDNTTERMYGYGAGTPSKFTRKIFVGDFDAQGGVPVTVTVEWRANLFSTIKTVTLQTYVYDHYTRFEI